MIICPVCSRENAESRRYCVQCGNRLHPVAPPVPPPEEHKEIPDNIPQLKEVQQQLDSVKQEKAQLDAGLAASQQEVQKLRLDLAAANKATDAAIKAIPLAGAGASESELADLRKQLDSVGQEKTKLQTELAKLRQTPGGSSAKRMPLIASGLVLAVLTAFGGFKYGQQRKNPSAQSKDQTIAADSTNDKAQIQQLQAQLDASRKNADEVTSQANAKDQEVKDANAKLATVTAQLAKAQRDASVALSNLGQKTQSEKEAQEQLQAANQMNRDVAAKAGQLAALQQLIQKHPEVTIIRWEGVINRPVTVMINQGRVSTDPSVSGSLNGELPGVCVAVQPMDKDVSIVKAPSAGNGWGDLSFRIEGTGHVAGKVRWSLCKTS
jgi:predicted RNase H-like nuclease (RuvC/YqgF family)